MTRVASFGLPGLDDTLAAARPTLLENDPGIDALPFALQAAAQALEQGRSIVYLAIDRPPRRVAAALAATGAKDEALARVHVLDAHSSLHGIPDPSAVHVDAGNIADVLIHLEQARADHPGALLVIDSINGLAMRAGSDRIAAMAARLHQVLARYEDPLAIHTRWEHDAGLQPFLLQFPDRVHLQGVHDRIITHEYFRIEQVDGRPYETAPVMYRNDGGRVRAYIPKILITGPADAGKTTFVHAICDHAVSAERAGKTVALDRGRLERDGLLVEVFGTPGQERFDPMMGPIMAQAVGIVLVVDSAEPSSFPRAMDMLRRAWRNGIPAVIAANKQDVEGAMDVEAVAKHLSAPEAIPVLACQASTRASALHVLDSLLSRILAPEVEA